MSGISSHKTPLHCNVPTARCDQYETSTRALTREAYECGVCGLLITRKEWVANIQRRARRLSAKAEKLEQLAKEVREMVVQPMAEEE